MSFCNRIAFAAILAATLAPAAAEAQTARTTSTDLNVSVSIRENCRISTYQVDFGVVDVTSAAAKDGIGSYLVQCTDGTPYTVSASVGGGGGASYSGRKMSSGANALGYNLYIDPARTLVFGDGTGATRTFIGVGNGDGQGNQIYGRVPGGQSSVPAGQYRDVVAVTVTY